ncbi:unnamed protein product [Brassica oleracea var. botrytis]
MVDLNLRFFQTSLYSVPEVFGLLFSLLFKQNELFPWIRRCLVLGLPVNLFLHSYMLDLCIFVPQPVTTCTGCSTSSPPHTVQFHVKH